MRNFAIAVLAILTLGCLQEAVESFNPYAVGVALLSAAGLVLLAVFAATEE